MTCLIPGLAGLVLSVLQTQLTPEFAHAESIKLRSSVLPKAPRTGVVDTISTACTGLVVRSDGNAGNDTFGPDSGRVHLDFAGSLDCEISNSTKTYVYGITPFVAYLSGSDSILNYSMYHDFGTPLHSFLDVGDGAPTLPTQQLADYELYMSGTFTSRDSTIALEAHWYAPTAPGSCRFVVQRIRFYSYDGTAHSSLKLGALCDWDVPSDFEVVNRAFWLAERKAIMFRGVDLDSGPVGCTNNNGRFAASVYLGHKNIGTGTIDTSSLPYSVRAVDWEAFIAPDLQLSRAMMWPVLTTPGFSASPDSTDLLAIVTLGSEFTVGLGDTIDLYMAHVVGIYTDSASFVQEIDAARAWFVDHFMGGFIAGDADGSGGVTISDAVYLISYIFAGGPAPSPLEAGDANCDSLVTISDAVYLIAYIFSGGPAPCSP